MAWLSAIAAHVAAAIAGRQAAIAIPIFLKLLSGTSGGKNVSSIDEVKNKTAVSHRTSAKKKPTATGKHTALAINQALLLIGQWLEGE